VSLPQEFNQPWTRKHDHPHVAHVPSAARTVYPESLQQLIELCRDQPVEQRLKAAGSHWGLSDAAVSDHTFIETHEPRELHTALGKTLNNVIPQCLNRDYVRRMVDMGTDGKWSLVHVEAGKRIYQLYAELDRVSDVGDTSTLGGFIADQFQDGGFGGPWAFETLGGAGGQTVVGAFTTGTHGGDFTLPPLADSVLAIHLVSDGGRHFWIERADPGIPALTDDFMMSLEFGTNELGGQGNFELIRDNDVFDAALVSVGRFGVIYSVVLKAVPQYALHEKRRLHLWQDIKGQIADTTSPLYADQRPPGVVSDQRFLQVAVSLTTHLNFQQNLVGVTKRWPLPPTVLTPGHAERVGDLEGFSDVIQAPRFSKAGRNHAYTPHPDHPERSAGPSMLEKACADASFVRGIINAVIDELEEFVATNGAVVGPTIAAVAAIGLGGLLVFLAAFLAIIVLLRELLDAIDDETRFGQVMEQTKNRLLDPTLPPAERAAGLFTWQAIYFAAFSGQQSARDYNALSYAVMDQRDYLNVSCEVNVESVEVFFNAVDSRLIAFIDQLILFEMGQEFEGKAFVGYASLRFTGPTRALIGMQRHDVTCSVEIACLKDVSGGKELIDFAVAWARNPNNGGILHWGQFNPWERDDVERIYGPSGDLGKWREALARITGGGDLFSSAFTQKNGLEVS
jgi:hypothetical protein